MPSRVMEKNICAVDSNSFFHSIEYEQKKTVHSIKPEATHRHADKTSIMAFFQLREK